MPDIRIDKEEANCKGRYVGRIAGIDGEAEITFRAETRSSSAPITPALPTV